MSAKDLILRPIDKPTADACVRRLHYSHKVVKNSQFSIGAYWQGSLEGALQFGPPLDKRKMLGLVRGTAWNQMVELNRMAFSERLPRNSESRALAIACRLLRRYAPEVKWILTFADATQCGDGTIYRAAGFLLTAIRKNSQIWALEDGTAVVLHGRTTATATVHRAAGAAPLRGFQVRYIKFLDASWSDRLTVPVLPYATIVESGARMVRGRSADSGTPDSIGRGRRTSDPSAPTRAPGETR